MSLIFRLDQPTAATFRHCVMKGDWTGEQRLEGI